MQFMFTSLWHIKAQQVHTQKLLWSHKAFMFKFFCFFLKQLHFSPSQEKRGQLMWRWWGFFFVLFFSVPFSQPLWHNPRKNSRHFRHDSRTISETLWHEAEQPSKRLVQSKERLQPLGAGSQMNGRQETRSSSESQSDIEIWRRAFADARV